MATPNPERVPDEQFYAGIRRQLCALANRVGAADCVALAEMVAIREEFDRHIESVIGQLRNDVECPASWTDIAEALGTTRGNACKRYAHLGGARAAGGQPGNWR